MPVINDYGSLWRGFVDNGMRSSIKTTEARSRVFTVYGDRNKFLRDLNLPSAEKVYMFVVRQDGNVLARADGNYSVKKAGPLLKAVGLN